MSNSKNILYLISLMLLMLTGCEADTSIAPFPNEGEEPVEVRFHATTVGASVEVSRANYEEKGLETGDKIGICNEWYDNIALDYTEGANPNLSIENNGKIYYPYQTTEMKVFAYAPYSATETDTENMTVNVRSEWEEDATYANYITAPLWSEPSTITKENPKAEFKFSHAMARLKITLENVPTASLSPYNHAIMLVFDCPQRGTMSLEDGSITPMETGGNYRYYIKYQKKQLADAIPTSYDYTILPGSKLKEIDVQYTDESGFIKKYYYKYTEDKPFNPFVAGTIIHMHIDFDKIRQQTKK